MRPIRSSTFSFPFCVLSLKRHDQGLTYICVLTVSLAENASSPRSLTHKLRRGLLTNRLRLFASVYFVGIGGSVSLPSHLHSKVRR